MKKLLLEQVPNLVKSQKFLVGLRELVKYDVLLKGKPSCLGNRAIDQSLVEIQLGFTLVQHMLLHLGLPVLAQVFALVYHL